jgi:hypothetical protein
MSMEAALMTMIELLKCLLTSTRDERSQWNEMQSQDCLRCDFEETRLLSRLLSKRRSMSRWVQIRLVD